MAVGIVTEFLVRSMRSWLSLWEEFFNKYSKWYLIVRNVIVLDFSTEPLPQNHFDTHYNKYHCYLNTNLIPYLNNFIFNSIIIDTVEDKVI